MNEITCARRMYLVDAGERRDSHKLFSINNKLILIRLHYMTKRVIVIAYQILLKRQATVDIQ